MRDVPIFFNGTCLGRWWQYSASSRADVSSARRSITQTSGGEIVSMLPVLCRPAHRNSQSLNTGAARTGLGATYLLPFGRAFAIAWRLQKIKMLETIGDHQGHPTFLT